MTTRKKPAPITAPAVPADEAFGNVIMAQRDTAVNEQQALQSQLVGREGQYERDMARLQAQFTVDRASLDEQIMRQGKIIAAAERAAKLKAGRLVREVSDTCLQYWGGMGFTWDNIASRAYRDTRLLSIGGGADEIMLGIICKLMNILPGKKKK